MSLFTNAEFNELFSNPRTALRVITRTKNTLENKIQQKLTLNLGSKLSQGHFAQPTKLSPNSKNSKKQEVISISTEDSDSNCRQFNFSDTEEPSKPEAEQTLDHFSKSKGRKTKKFNHILDLLLKIEETSLALRVLKKSEVDSLRKKTREFLDVVFRNFDVFRLQQFRSITLAILMLTAQDLRLDNKMLMESIIQVLGKTQKKRGKLIQKSKAYKLLKEILVKGKKM